jgi:hypothetical protein
MSRSSFDVNFPVRPGETFQMFYLEEPSKQAVLKSDDAGLNQLREEFRHTASRIPISIAFCSTTGRYCEDMATENETCPLN